MKPFRRVAPEVLDSLIDIARVLNSPVGGLPPAKSQTWLAKLEGKVSNHYLLQHMVLLFRLISSSMHPNLGSSSYPFRWNLGAS